MNKMGLIRGSLMFLFARKGGVKFIISRAIIAFERVSPDIVGGA
jgi:hypothetical protein